jgi:hypothetical protein
MRLICRLNPLPLYPTCASLMLRELQTIEVPSNMAYQSPEGTNFLMKMDFMRSTEKMKDQRKVSAIAKHGNSHFEA